MGQMDKELPIVIWSSDQKRIEMVKRYFEKLENCKPVIKVLQSLSDSTALQEEKVSNLCVDVTEGLSEEELIRLYERFNANRTSFFKDGSYDQVQSHYLALCSHGY